MVYCKESAKFQARARNFTYLIRISDPLLLEQIPQILAAAGAAMIHFLALGGKITYMALGRSDFKILSEVFFDRFGF